MSTGEPTSTRSRCTAFNLLTGSAPFQHSNPAVVITQHLSAPPPHISERRPELAVLDGAFAKALAKSPGDRYPTCADFAAALGSQLDTAPAEIAASTEVIAAPTEVMAKPPPKARSGRRRMATAIGAIVAVAVAGVAILVGVHMFGPKSKHPVSKSPSESVAAPTSGAAAPPAITLSSQVTDQSGVLGPLERDAVNRAVTKLYNLRGTRLWVLYVKNFGGIKPSVWATDVMHANSFTNADALLAIATDEPAFSFRVPTAVTAGTGIDVEAIRRDHIQPAVYHREWTRAAIAAANGLDL